MRTWNTLKTTLLLAALTGMFVLTGSLLGGTGGMVIAFILAVLMNMGAWWFSDKIALKLSGAREASLQEAPELHHIVETLAERAGLPKPRVYIMDANTPNAFATGRSPNHAAVAVTTGLMELLTYDEVSAVIAHELAHIKHRDTLISSIAATVAGAITMIADMAMWSLLFGGSDEEEGAGSLVGGLLMLIIAPIAALLIQLAISRSREFSADAGDARILGNALPLVHALEKLERESQNREPMHVNPATSHLYIVNPLHGDGLINLFRTHPPTHERIARLRAINPLELATA